MVGRLTLGAIAVLTALASMAAVPRPATSFVALADVRMTGGDGLEAMKSAGAKLMAIDPAKLVYPYRKAAGLPAKCAAPGDPAEKSPQTAGRLLGHYLSAMSALWSTTRKDAVKDRVDYVVEELYGCAAAAKASRRRFFMTVPEQAAFVNETPAFPARTAYAVLKGLVDAHSLTGNQRAFDLAKGWVDYYRDIWFKAKQPDPEATKKARAKFLSGDWGGLNRIFLLIYCDFGVVNYFHDGWNCFNQTPYFDELRKGRYDFAAEPAASLAAKMEGLYMRHRLTGWEELRKASVAYLDYAVKTKRYGDGDDEATRDLMSLASRIFEESPSAELMDFIDAKIATLTKAALASKGPCAADAVVLSQARYAYSTSPRTIRVNRYIPSKAAFREKGIVLVTKVVGRRATITVRMTGKAVSQRIMFRSVGGAVPRISVNAAQTVSKANGDGYWAVDREWKDGDMIDVLF